MSEVYHLNPVEKNIIKTLSFFDLFDYPLTLWELWQYFPEKIDILSLKKTIDEQFGIKQHQGFYFLENRQEIVLIRNRRYNFANRKIVIAKRVARIFRLLPSIKLVAVANLIGHHNLREGSDIDIFIITSPNRLWLARLFCAGLMKLLHMRPSARNKKNKICLSFYASVTSLNLEDMRNEPNDPYFDYWLLGLFSVYDVDNYLPFLWHNNKWLQKIFPNCLLLENNFSDDHFRRDLVEKIFFQLGNAANFVSKKIQTFIMPTELKNLSVLRQGVIINDAILKFYTHDRRAEFYERYLNKLKELKVYD